MEVRLPRLPLALAALCAGALAACGSSANSSSGTTTTTTTTTTATSSASLSSPAAGGNEVATTTPCSSAQFGSPLQPKGAPGDVHTYASAPAKQIDDTRLYLATISTDRGDIVLCLQPKLAPNTVNNFVVLARNHFYDGLKFHRVVQGFVIQGGDPKGDGTGGPGYEFADEPVQGSYSTGCVAMANAGPNTNGSQFFVCIADDTQLPKQYNLFGQVTKGIDVALKIQQGDAMKSVTVQESQ